MTGQVVLALVNKHGSVNKAAKAAGVAKSTFQEWVKKARGGINPRDEVRTESLKGLGDVAPREVKVSAPTGGFSLEEAQVFAKRPTDVWGLRFNALRVNIGYLPATLAQQWGCSVNTVRERARAAGAIRYTERDGQYIEVVTNPKTKGGK